MLAKENKEVKLKNRDSIRIDQLMTINLNDPSSKNIITFQLLLESNILSCYIKDNLDKTLFTKNELNKYEEFINYIIDNFESEGIRINGKEDKFLTGLLRKASIKRLVKMVDSDTMIINDKYLFINRLINIGTKIKEDDSKYISDVIYINFKDEFNQNKLNRIISNPNLQSVIEYLIHRNLIKEIDEKILYEWIMFLDENISKCKGTVYYRLRHSLVNLINKYNNIQEAKGYLGYERLELE